MDDSNAGRNPHRIELRSISRWRLRRAHRMVRRVERTTGWSTVKCGPDGSPMGEFRSYEVGGP